MTWLAPGFLLAAGVAAAAVVALHFIVTREPRTAPLPTARFAPDRPVAARDRAVRLADLLLLFCRVALVLLAGAALAQPVPAPRRRPVARVLVVDRSAGAASPAELGDSVRALAGPDDRLVSFDSLAPVGRLSAGLILGLRAAAAARESADSVELAVVSPFAAEERDQATDSIRALWPGSVRLIRVALRADSPPAAAPALIGAADDPLRLALPVQGPAEPAVRIVRGVVAPADSAWALGAGRTLVLWPAATSGVIRDTVGAVSAGTVAVVAPFPRGSALRVPPESRVAARWVDGEPAAVEATMGAGCVRTVTIPVPSVGDLVLDPRFVALVSRLVGPCGARPLLHPMDPARLAALTGAGARQRVPRGAIGAPERRRSPLAPWLLGAALVLAGAELGLRRRATAPGAGAG